MIKKNIAEQNREKNNCYHLTQLSGNELLKLNAKPFRVCLVKLQKWDHIMNNNT